MKLYLRSAATSPGPTPTSDTITNTPTGAGIYTLHTPGKLLTTKGSPSTTTITGIPNNTARGMLWVTEAGVPNLGTFAKGGWTLKLRVTALGGTSGTSFSVLVGARIVRLDSNNVIQAAGTFTGSADATVNSTDFAQSPLPRLLTLDIPPTNWSAGSASDRLGLQVYVQDNGPQTATNFSIEVDGASSYLTDEVSVETAESFDFLSLLSTNNAGAFCLSGGFGCGVPLTNTKTPRHGTLIGADGGWGALSYLLVPGLRDGSGHAIKAPSGVCCFKENSNVADTWIIDFLVRLDALGTIRQLVTVGGSDASRDISVDINTSNQLELRRGGSVAGAGTLLATSDQTVALGQYHVEFDLYKHATLGSFEVRLNGQTVSWGAAAVTGVNTTNAQRACSWTNPDITIDEVFIKTGNTSGILDADHVATTFRLPVVKTLRPVQQGSKSDFEQWGDPTPVFKAAGGSTNWIRVSENNDDGPLTLLASVTTGSRDSWILEELEGADTILAFITSLNCVGPVGTNVNIHEVYLGGTAYQIDDVGGGGGALRDLDYELLNTGSQYHRTARLWTEKPDGTGPWLPTDFVSLEIGVGSFNVVDIYITQARAIVVYYEPLPEEQPNPTDLGSECAPCDEASLFRFPDSHLVYNGVNDDLSSAMSLLLAPGADWSAVGLQHTLVSDGEFVAADATLGRAFRLGDPGPNWNGDYVILDVVSFTSADELIVTNRTAVPASLQRGSTTAWARMVNGVSGLDHLEGEEVVANIDGRPYGPWTVILGAVEFTDALGAEVHAAVACVGLKVICDWVSLDVDYPEQGRSSSKVAKTINELFVLLYKSREFDYLSGDADDDSNRKTITLLSKTEQQNTPARLKTKKITVPVLARVGEGGRIRIRHDKPLPLTILAWTPIVELHGTRTGA